MPTAFDTLYVDVAQPALVEWFGLAVTYTAADRTATAATALVGEEEVRQEPGKHGRKIRRELEVSIFKSDVASVTVTGKFTIDGEVWPIEEIIAETGSETLVRAVRIETVEVARPGFRGTP